MGVVIGALTERLASRNVYLISNRLWNTAVNLAVFSFLWTRLISLHPSFNDESAQNKCLLPSSAPFLFHGHLYSSNIPVNIDEYGVCSVTQGIEIVIILILKFSLLYISTRFGVSLQPVGITGGIACGKSSVSKIVQGTSESSKKDALAIVDVDAIAHDILVPGKMKEEDSAYQRVVSTFSDDDILEKSNDTSQNKTVNPPQIDRRKLGDVIFRDHTKRRKLNSITHPLISKVMLKEIIRENFSPSSNDTSIVAVDIPLLFEVGLKMRLLFAVKVVVACSSAIQHERLRLRNPDLTVDQCSKRIQSQIPVYKKVEMADIVIWNNGTMDDLIREVERAREEIISRKYGFLGITLPRLIIFVGFLTTSTCIFDIIFQ